MKDDTTILPFHQPDSVADPLTEIARDGARRMLAEALKAEADTFVASFADETLPDGRQRVVRHGHGPERSIQTRIGALDGELRERGRKCGTALDQIWPDTRHQRCWVHKIGNVLNAFPKAMAPAVKSDLHDISHAGTRANALAALNVFEDKYAAKYPKAATCLTTDRDALTAFHDFPAEHWDHLRSSTPIESVFATVRHRTVRTKGRCRRRPPG